MPLAAFYGRVSTDRQDTSLNDQAARALAYGQGRTDPLTIPDDLIFTDFDTSGGIPLPERPGGAELQRVIVARGVKHLVVTKLDRIGRDSLDGELFMRWLREHGIILHVLDLGGESMSTAGAFGELLIKIIFAIAEWDKKNIGTNIRNAIGQKRQRGEVIGTVPYGWRSEGTGQFRSRGDAQVEIRRLVPDPDQQHVLRQIILPRRFADRWGTVRIARELNDLAIPTRQAPGELVKGHQGLAVPSRGIWTQRHVDRILANTYTRQLAHELGYRQ